MTNPASATIDAGCGLFVTAIEGFRGMTLDSGIRGERDKQKCRATEMLMSAVTSLPLLFYTMF
jgi:hypothetical protein